MASRRIKGSCKCHQNVDQTDLREDKKKPELLEKNGHTYGTYAAKAGCISCVQSLLSRNIDPNMSTNHNGSTMLHYAALNGRPAVVELLCENSANVNQANKRIRTALHEAATTGNEEVVKLLLRYGANVMNKNKYGRTSLHIATKYENYKVRDLLVHHRQKELEDVLNQTFGVHIYRSLIHLIVEFTCNTADQTEVCFCAQDLEDNDIQYDYKIPNNEHGHTVATKSAVSGCVKCCNWLIKCGLDINKPVTNDGSTMLYCAVYKQRLPCVRLLCEMGADVNVSNYRERLPLRCAINNDKPEIVDILCEHGADLNSLPQSLMITNLVQRTLEYHRQYRQLEINLRDYANDADEIINGDHRWNNVKFRFRQHCETLIGHATFTTILTHEKIDGKMQPILATLESVLRTAHLAWVEDTHKDTRED